ncbi:MAG: hypothetical protein N3I35_08555 [Clostridia bacterium]|nr:hypothetical protein [Clostridia bacterium]
MELYHAGKGKGKELTKHQIELNEAHVLAEDELLSHSIAGGLKVLNARLAE